MEIKKDNAKQLDYLLKLTLEEAISEPEIMKEMHNEFGISEDQTRKLLMVLISDGHLVVGDDPGKVNEKMTTTNNMLLKHNRNEAIKWIIIGFVAGVFSTIIIISYLL